MTSPARRPPPIARSRYRAGTLAAFAAFAGIGSVEGTASADHDDKQVCVAASEKGQQLRTAGKLVEAREQFILCGRAECPKLIQQDCTQWTSEVIAALPSVVPGATDRNGRDIVDARLTVDGKVVTETLDGKPIVLDPGVHAFVFETKGAAGAPAMTVKEQVVVKPGEKNRIVTVTFGAADTGSKPVPAAPAPQDAREPHDAHASDVPSKSSPPVVAYVLGGLGIVALGTAGVMGLLANGDAHDLRTSCAPNCKQSDVDAIQTRYTISGVTAGIGGALLVTGVVLFILHNRDSERVAGEGSPALLRF